MWEQAERQLPGRLAQWKEGLAWVLYEHAAPAAGVATGQPRMGIPQYPTIIRADLHLATPYVAIAVRS
jgi:hypothetical protein